MELIKYCAEAGLQVFYKDDIAVISGQNYSIEVSNDIKFIIHGHTFTVNDPHELIRAVKMGLHNKLLNMVAACGPYVVRGRVLEWYEDTTDAVINTSSVLIEVRNRGIKIAQLRGFDIDNIRKYAPELYTRELISEVNGMIIANYC